MSTEQSTCPRCQREARAWSRVFGVDQPTTYICDCGCTWACPARLPPLASGGIANAKLHAGPRSKPCDETCPKCGGMAVTIQWLGVEMIRLTEERDILTEGKRDVLRLRCACGYTWEREPLRVDGPPTLDTRPIHPKAPGDPLQANVTLGVLHKILEERDAVLVQKLKGDMR